MYILRSRCHWLGYFLYLFLYKCDNCFIRFKESRDDRIQYYDTWVDERQTFCYLELQMREGCQAGSHRGLNQRQSSRKLGLQGEASVWQEGWNYFSAPCRLANVSNFMGSRVQFSLAFWYLALGQLR